MELNDAEVQCLLWLLMQGGSATLADWRSMRDEIDAGHNTNLRHRRCIVFYDHGSVVKITETGKKAVEAACPKN